MLWLFFIGLLSVNYLSKNNRIQSVNYSNLFPIQGEYDKSIKNKKVMMLTPGWSLYRQNSLGGIFLNWDLSKEIFEELDNYRNIETVASSFETEEPEIIVDEQNYMQQVMERIPELKKKYRKEGKLYRKISN
jgi:hypothetical protein